MDTEITESFEGWLFYDGECRVCHAWAARLKETLQRRKIGLAPLQSPWVSQRLGLAGNRDLNEMKVITLQGEVVGGADAVLYIARFVWWAWPLLVFEWLPMFKPLLHAAYRWLAVRRHCVKGGCVR